MKETFAYILINMIFVYPALILNNYDYHSITVIMIIIIVHHLLPERCIILFIIMIALYEV